jgi:hypothetical protein
MEQLSHFENEGRVAQIGKLLAIGIDVGDELTVDIKLEVVAVRANDRFRESDRCVAARPMKRRFEHNFLGRIALRFVEPRCRLWFAEYISDTVITDAVAGPEICMRVVIEGAPANAAGILRIGRKLVVDAGVTQGVLGEAFHLVDGLGGIGVSYKFRV